MTLTMGLWIALSLMIVLAAGLYGWGIRANRDSELLGRHAVRGNAAMIESMAYIRDSETIPKEDKRRLAIVFENYVIDTKEIVAESWGLK
jgi:hypothetical protein